MNTYKCELCGETLNVLDQPSHMDTHAEPTVETVEIYTVDHDFPNHPKYARRIKRVSITSGYTEFEDIRKILAIMVGLKPADVRIFAIIRNP